MENTSGKNGKGAYVKARMVKLKECHGPLLNSVEGKWKMILEEI